MTGASFNSGSEKPGDMAAASVPASAAGVPTSASLLLGLRLLHAGGANARVAEILVKPAADPVHVAGLVIGHGAARRLVRVDAIAPPSNGASALVWTGIAEAIADSELDRQLLLDRDVLDQQIIDIDGHKVVRVNDVDLCWQVAEGALSLQIVSVEIGVRGASRRLLKGLPVRAIGAVAGRLPTKAIPWAFVDLIERDPSRRVHLKIGQGRLESLHPSDIADILEELAPAEREALFSSLDEETAAETLEEVAPRLQRELLENMDEARAADIMEEMDPGAAADVLGELSDEDSDAILAEMEPEDRQEVAELLEFPENSAAGRMTTYFVGVDDSLTATAAVAALREFVERDEGDVDRVPELLLLNAEGQLSGLVSTARLLLALPDAPLMELTEGHKVYCRLGASERDVAALFDKYNLLTLPVVNDAGVVQGVVLADKVIAGLLDS